MSNSNQDNGNPSSIEIIVNGRPRSVPKSDRDLSYLEVIDLAFPGEVPTEQIVFTVTYSEKNGAQGSLVEGQSVKAKKGMVFNVGKTDLS